MTPHAMGRGAASGSTCATGSSQQTRLASAKLKLITKISPFFIETWVRHAERSVPGSDGNNLDLTAYVARALHKDKAEGRFVMVLMVKNEAVAMRLPRPTFLGGRYF